MRRIAVALALSLAFTATVALGQDAAPLTSPPPAATGPETKGPGIEEGGGILHGNHHAFAVSAPKGWLFDNQSGVPQGLHAVAYRKGETYATSESLLYARGNDPDPQRTLDQFIAADLADFNAKSPGLQTFDVGPLTLGDDTPVRTLGFRGDAWGNVEAVAYVEHDGAICVLVLTARSQARFDADLPAFREFVRSVLPMERGEDRGAD